MELAHIINQLQLLGTEQNRKVYKKHGAGDNLYGVSFANLLKLKKQVVSPEGRKGVHHRLGLRLWETGNADARTLACMIFESDRFDRETLERMVAEVDYHVVADKFAESVSYSPFYKQLSEEWMDRGEEFIKRCGFMVIAMRLKNKLPVETDLEKIVNKIESEIDKAPNRAREGMNNTLIMIGIQSQVLCERAMESAKRIGEVEVDHGETACKTYDAVHEIRRIAKRKKWYQSLS